MIKVSRKNISCIFFNSNIFNSLNNFDFNSEGHEMK